MTTTHITPAQAVATYFDAWRDGDFDRFESVLADGVTFRGPLGEADGAPDCRAGIEQMSRIVTDIVIEKTFVDGDDVLTWFELHTTVAPPAAVANWSHVGDGGIDRIRVTFDARRLAPPPPTP
jgi:ketosteroid isomerase-like protein